MKAWLLDRRGAAAVEYALIAAVIAFLVLAGLSVLGSAISGVLESASALITAK